jgi:5-deoxy-glucuronate isomerase
LTSSPTPMGRDLLRRTALAPGAVGEVNLITPATAGWSYVGFGAWRLGAGATLSEPPGDLERLVLVLEGTASVVAGDQDFGVLGSRVTVFDGPPPPVVLVAPGTGVEVRAETACLVVIASAPGASIGRTAYTPPEEVFVESRGSGNTERRIHHLLSPRDEAGHLIAFEVFTPGGNWSSYPPHKHDTEDPPREAHLEELYFYRFARPTGFAVQRVYTADGTLEETFTTRDDDIVLVPRGYHVVGTAAGYDCYYLNIMAGPNRAWYFTVDPDHEWLMTWDPATPRKA